MNDLNIRQSKFVRKITKEGKPKSVAYAETYGGDPLDPNVQSSASHLASNPKVVKTLEQIETELASDAAEAYESYKELMKDPKTPSQIKEKGYAHIMNLGGLRATQQTDVKDERIMKGLNDDKSIIELAELAIKKRKGGEDNKDE